MPTLPLSGINSDSAGNYQLIDVESTVRMGNGFSAGNYQLLEADSDREDQNVRKILKAVTISGSASTTPMYCTAKVNFNTKTSLK
jgi:hypothetical protein